jgi:hypothetical protein
LVPEKDWVGNASPATKTPPGSTDARGGLDMPVVNAFVVAEYVPTGE